MGTEELSKLKELTLPEPISYLPQTPAWYILFAFITIIILYLLWRKYLHYKKNLYRKEALSELSKIRKDKSYKAIPELVKRVALVFSNREEVASLSNTAWLDYLNKTYNGSGFTTETGKLLITLAYSSPSKFSQYQQGEIDALFNLISEWIKKHNA